MGSPNKRVYAFKTRENKLAGLTRAVVLEKCKALYILSHNGFVLGYTIMGLASIKKPLRQTKRRNKR